MAAKGGREKIKLESTAGTGHFYTTSKNKKTTPQKLEARGLQGSEAEVIQLLVLLPKAPSPSCPQSPLSTRLSGLFVVPWQALIWPWRGA